MRGELVIISPDGKETCREITAEPELETLQKAVGGYIELVASFDTMTIRDGSQAPCFAFCNEQGKLDDLSYNHIATVLWDKALRHAGGPGLLQHGRPIDVLCGSVAIITGDPEFLRSMGEDADEADDAA